MKLGPYELGYTTADHAGVYEGDARELAQAVPDESVDLVFTDPIYQNIGDFRWLAETAYRVLKPNRPCLVWCGIEYLPLVLQAMSHDLSYVWQFASVLPVGKRGKWAQYKMFSNYRALLWFEKGNSQGATYFSDVQFEKDNRYDGLNGWGKSLVTTNWWMQPFDGLVFDPFTGGGTVPAVCKQLGRPYLAFEIDPDIVQLARQRVHDTQPPLFTLEPEQLSLALPVTEEAAD